MRQEIVLEPGETVPGRPFTDPGHTTSDERRLQELLALERARARAWADEPPAQGLVVEETNGGGLRHLLVVPDPRALLAAEEPTVVGFFGRPREDADSALLFALEEEIVSGMKDAPALLSYYDVELVKGAYGNLILFASPEGPRLWRENAAHGRAVAISPASYHEIRLHQGVLAGPFGGDGTLRLQRTRYIDYRDAVPWYAVRSR